jgi:hypothetical protein
LLLDKQEPSYVLRAMREALAEQLAPPDAIMDAAGHRKSRTGALQARTGLRAAGRE